MTRLSLLLVLLSSGAWAQNLDPIGPGTRLRVYWAPERLPPDGMVRTGTIEALADTLVLRTDAGPVLRFVPRDVDGFEVSLGRTAYPYWLPIVTASVGGAVGYFVGRSFTFNPSLGCQVSFCSTTTAGDRTGQTIIAAVGLTVGGLAGIYIGNAISRERWVPATSVYPTTDGAALSVRF